MKEYKIFKIYEITEHLEKKLNAYAEEGWKIICSYGYDNQFLIMERDKR